MKKLTFILGIFLAISCSSNKKENIVTLFIEDTKSLEKNENSRPIIEFLKVANKLADKKIVLNKQNIKESLLLAKKYKSYIISVEDHTLVKINNLENNKASGSWSTSMPFGEGYIQKGTLIYKEEYINNIIGSPDSQERIMFLFK